MVIVEHRRPFGFTLREAYFPDREELDRLVGGLAPRTMLRARQTRVVMGDHPWLVQRSPCPTGVIDLTGGIEQTFARLRRTTRQAIYRADALADRITITRNDPASLPAYRQLHNCFLDHTQHTTPMSAGELAEWAPVADVFVLSLDGRPLVGHLLVPDHELGRVVVQYSCSMRHQVSRKDAGLVATCNRILHWNEIQYYTGLGMRVFDFGGLRDGDDPGSFFKLTFGATRIDEHFYVFARPLIRLALRLHRTPGIQALRRLVRT